MRPEASEPDFDRLHAAHRDAIGGYLRRLTHDVQLSEELAQETFLRVSRGLAGFRGDANPSTWIYRIATNVYLDHCRRLSSGIREGESRTVSLEELPDSQAPAAPPPLLPDRLLEDSEMGACIRQFIDGLAPESRAVLVLHDLQGLGIAEIASILDASPGSVKIRVHRARRQLRTLLAEHCDFDRGEDDVLRCDRKPTDPR